MSTEQVRDETNKNMNESNSSAIEVSNCPTCNHFPTQFISTDEGIQHRSLKLPEKRGGLCSDEWKTKIEELVKATLIMGCRRGGDYTHDTALERIRDSIPSLTQRFMDIEPEIIPLTQPEIAELVNFVNGVILHGSRNFIYLDNVESVRERLYEVYDEPQ